MVELCEFRINISLGTWLIDWLIDFLPFVVLQSPTTTEWKIFMARKRICWYEFISPAKMMWHRRGIRTNRISGCAKSPHKNTQQPRTAVVIFHFSPPPRSSLNITRHPPQSIAGGAESKFECLQFIHGRIFQCSVAMGQSETCSLLLARTGLSTHAWHCAFPTA